MLLIVDMQQGAVSGCFQEKEAIQRVASLVERARGKEVPVVSVVHDPVGAGTTDSELVRGLTRLPNEPVIRKEYRDSFTRSDLTPDFDRLGEKLLVAAGDQSDFCIRITTQRAAVLGLDVTRVVDAHTT